MTRRIAHAVVGLLALGVVSAVYGQGTSPPTVEIIEWRVLRGPDAVPQQPRPGGGPPVYSKDRGDPRSNIQGVGPNNAGAFLHMSYDRASGQGDVVQVVIRIVDPDWATATDEPDGVFYRFQALPRPYSTYPPAVPPIVETSDAFIGVTERDGFAPPPGQTYLDLTLEFRIPTFTGKNQARLRGWIEWDVRWYVWIEVSNDKEPGDDALLYRDAAYVVAVENPALGMPNPPPFADAGADQTVAAGSTVTLDGRRSFDAYNIGFDPDDPNVFEKDTLEYVWEWISGPQRVDPVYVDDYGYELPAGLARVTLDVTGTYEYRLLVTDGVNPLPSTDSVLIRVVPTLPVNRPPRAVVSGPTAPVAVGEIVTLDGSGSYDPDGDTLAYRWRQTDEIGGELPPADFATFFQPLSGLEEATSRWQALVPGTFYFRLLVDDGEYTNAASISVEVVPAAAGGAAAGAAAEYGDESALEALGLGPLGGAGACGTGLLPLAVVPALLWPLRSRRW